MKMGSLRRMARTNKNPLSSPSHETTAPVIDRV